VICFKVYIKLDYLCFELILPHLTDSQNITLGMKLVSPWKSKKNKN